jgi:hypothetical protein
MLPSPGQVVGLPRSGDQPLLHVRGPAIPPGGSRSFCAALYSNGISAVKGVRAGQPRSSFARPTAVRSQQARGGLASGAVVGFCGNLLRARMPVTWGEGDHDRRLLE